MNKLVRAPQETEQDRALVQESLEAITLMLSPIIPHACFEMWKRSVTKQTSISHNGLLLMKAMIDDTKLVVVQVNGKVRGRITVPADANQEFVLDMAK